jgi:3-methyladenine DNA glycosylase/8-oxoguanine DNA glycosylase
LVRLLGVGPYTAELALIRGAGRGDGLFLDVYIRQALSQLYFGGARLPDEQRRDFARAKMGPYQAYAAVYLTTDTDAWARDLDVDFRLRSGAERSRPGKIAAP